MAEKSNNRNKTLWSDILYNDVMHSDGYVVEYAVCTTYSLDMPTLLSVPFMLGAMAELDNDLINTHPHLILEAIDRSAGKFAVFCNAGCIAVPQNNLKVYSLLEKSVVQVALAQKGGGFINFHPKVWVIKERCKATGATRIKVVVLSRNLTSSNDLDVVCEMTADVGIEEVAPEEQKRHQPLVDFLQWLKKYTKSKSIRKNIDAICGDIMKIKEFSLADSPFENYEFFPMGIGNVYDGGKCLEDSVLGKGVLNGARDVVVISPFIDNDVLAKVCDPSINKRTLITRYSSLTKDLMDEFNTKINDGIYVPKEVMLSGAEGDAIVDLHEKVYFVTTKENVHNLYLGSTNATKNGFCRNVEFLLHLQFKRYQTDYKAFRNELVTGDDCMFEQVTSVPDDNGLQDDKSILAEQYLRTVIGAIEGAEVQEVSGKYNVTIKCENVNQPGVFLRPLGTDECYKQDMSTKVEFKSLALLQLTEFYIIETGDMRRVIKIDTTNMPTAERDAAIFSSVIDTKGKFIDYLSFMLAGSGEQFLLNSRQRGNDCSVRGNNEDTNVVFTSLYEDMMRMAHTDPERVKEIDKLLKKMKNKGLTENIDGLDEFKKMYTAFKDAIDEIDVIKKKTP
ncbi:MAG: hypothetical protein J6Q73_05140 [Bacteroidaceae bacterium]|nr:hypothetical protein [Bacteroidaceae bacterium]